MDSMLKYYKSQSARFHGFSIDKINSYTMGGAASKTKQTKKEAGGPMRGVVPGAGQDEAAVGDGAAAGGGAAAAVPAETVPDASGGASGRVGEEEEGESKGEGAGEGAPDGGEAKVELSDEDKEVKGRVFPEGKPPKEVAWWEDATVLPEGIDPVDYEREHRHALAWLKLAFPLAHKDSDTKHWIKRLLAVNYFTGNMSYMEILEPLRTFCGERLLLAGAPLQALFQTDGDVRGLAELAPAPLEAVAHVAHLRQDHPAVGLAPPPGADPTTLEGESVYIHFLRLVALALNEKFQTLVERVVDPLGGEHKGCAIKGDARMRNKALAADDHRYATKPRPALNIDIVRCCVTFNDVASLRRGVEAVVAAVARDGGGVGRVKNGFKLEEAEAARSFHYRSFMVNLVVDFGCTFGEACGTTEVAKAFDAHVNAWKARNPNVPWGRWRKEARAALDAVKSEAMSKRRAVMVCEVQFLLRPYLDARREMHLLYKVVRAASDKHLAQQFAVAKEEEGRGKEATWASEERREVEKARREVEAGEALALWGACDGGFLKAVEVALQQEGVDVNQASPSDGSTPLWQACFYGHLDVVRALLGADGIQANQAEEDGCTPLIIAAYIGHSEVVSLLLGTDALDTSCTCSEKTALEWAQADARNEAWAFLDGKIKQEGRARVRDLLCTP